MARPSRRTRHRPSASWTRVMLTQEDRMRRRLQQRHWLRLHAALTGGLSLAGMSLLSLGLLHAGTGTPAVLVLLLAPAGALAAGVQRLGRQASTIDRLEREQATLLEQVRSDEILAPLTL